MRGKGHPGYRHGEATKAARAEMKQVNRLGRAMQMLDRASTPGEIRAAVEFARNAMAREPGRG